MASKPKPMAAGALGRPRALARALLAWYDAHCRRFPWRARAGEAADPYRVWLAEIMLQQTTTRSVEPYYQAFLARWPGIEELAAAPLDDVLHAWQGLGYYARARNLHRTARIVAGERGGAFPADEAALRALPGIGPYTAAAIAAIAFARRAVVVDGNVTRVVVRLAGLEAPPARIRGAIRALADELTPAARPGDYAQAIMDLGATVCTPRAPDCARCPWRRACRARAAGIADALPRKVARAAKPMRHGVAFWTLDAKGRVLLRRRPENGLLGGMMEVPSTDWRERAWSLSSARRRAPLAASWRRLPGVVRHGFSHFDLELAVLTGRVEAPDAIAGVWCAPERLGDHALPTVMKKVVRHALAAASEDPRPASTPRARARARSDPPPAARR